MNTNTGLGSKSETQGIQVHNSLANTKLKDGAHVKIYFNSLVKVH